ncbi:MAG: hypothetical protein M3406_09275 [Chloroflexota bacterium]|nr:hypothetical protein [Chloroflexota bacterium]
MAIATQPEMSGAGWAIRHGLIGGAIAGIIFALAEMFGSVLMGMPFLAPFQAFASLALGIPPPDIPLGTAIPVGTVAHMLLSVIYGVAFAFAVQNLALLRTSPPATIIAATLFGIALWFVNFNILAVPIGRPWFAEAPAIPQFIYHAVFFGPPLGLYIATQLPSAHAEPGPTS